MKNEKSCLNVSIVFFEKYNKSEKYQPKLDIFLNLIKFLDNDVNIKKILVVDNSPIDKIKINLKNYKKVKYFFANKNLGFSKGHNLSKKFLENEKYHLILNPDIFIEDENLFKNLINFLDTDKNIAMVQPMILDYKGDNIQYLCKESFTPYSNNKRFF